MHRVAIIEDDQPTNDVFKKYIQSEWADAEILQFFSFDTAAHAIETEKFDLIVSDLDLGHGTDKLGGIKIAKMMDSVKAPLLIVSGAPQPELHREIFKALGAWDYLEKPVLEHDFITQVIRAIYFRTGTAEKATFSVISKEGLTPDSQLIIDRRARLPVSWRKVPVHLSLTEIRLVSELVEKKGVVISYEKLFKLLNTGQNLANLRVHIQNIRAAFKDADPDFGRIQSKMLVGYYWGD